MTKLLPYLYFSLFLLISSLCTGQISNLAEDTITYSIDIKDIVISGEYAPTDTKKSTYKVEVLDIKKLEKQGIISVEEALKTSSSL